jgi:DNA invertase Pin-like site-specific DNA recombinase
MLRVLGGLAEFERDLICTRTSEGRVRAANGVRLGRKPTLTPHQQREAIKRVNEEKETLGEIARVTPDETRPGWGRMAGPAAGPCGGRGPQR